MRALVLVALCAGCEGGSSPPVVVHDAAPDVFIEDDEGFCNPILQAGCNAGEKCTQRGISSTVDLGRDCEPEGTLPIGASCAGAELDCVKGGMCVGGTCRRFCDVGHAACPAADTCTSITPPGHLIGVCEPRAF